MKTRKINSIDIYWDCQDFANEGWAYRAKDENNETIDSGPIELVVDDDLVGAIREACHILGVDLTPDDFGCDPNRDGGFASWLDPQVDNNIERQHDLNDMVAQLDLIRGTGGILDDCLDEIRLLGFELHQAKTNRFDVVLPGCSHLDGSNCVVGEVRITGESDCNGKGVLLAKIC